jgi:hypothetical protein
MYFGGAASFVGLARRHWRTKQRQDRAVAGGGRLILRRGNVAKHLKCYKGRMDNPIHLFSDLFAQLGLPADEPGIRQFIAAHTPLAADLELPLASFWTPAQAAFLREALLQDSDWAELVDQLSQALRRPGRVSQ